MYTQQPKTRWPRARTALSGKRRLRSLILRGDVRLQDLMARRPARTRLVNVKIPAHVAQSVDQIADHVHASKTKVVIALLNHGLLATKRFAALVLILLSLVMASTAFAKTFCMVKVHGKGGPELADPSWAEDYWANGQFQAIAQPCNGMPTLTTHADGTVGFYVANDLAYCGCRSNSYYGCEYRYTPPAGHADPGLNSPYPNGYWGPGDNDVCTRTGPYWPHQWPLAAPGWQGVVEQINTFLDQTGCDDLTIVTHSNGANVIRWAFSQLTTSDLYDNTSCREGRKSKGAIDPGCEARHQHLLRVVNATTHVITLHAPFLGSETANLAQWLLTNQFSFITGWLADWLGGNNDATQQLTTGRMWQWNSRFLHGTQANAFPSELGGTPARPWPVYSLRGESMRVARWIAIASHMPAYLMAENYADPEDIELLGLAGVVSYPPSGQSDGLVGWPSQVGVFSGSADVWYASGQHDQAAAAQYTGQGNNGNNHNHARLGGQGGGGQWRPGVFTHELCDGFTSCYSFNFVPAGISGPAPPAGPGPCQSTVLNANQTLFTCPSWPRPSVSHPVAVQACPDSICARNQVRGYPAGADEAFWISAFIGARAASYCGPAISYYGNIPNGQKTYYYQNIMVKQNMVPITYWAYGSWLFAGAVDIYNPSYAPNAGMQVCGWQC
jgi:hypothetical protein